MVNCALAGRGSPTRMSPFRRMRLCPAGSPCCTFGQLAPSTEANTGSAPRVSRKRRRTPAALMLNAWVAMWQEPQLRPFVPRLWKNALSGFVRPLRLTVARTPLGSADASKPTRPAAWLPGGSANAGFKGIAAMAISNTSGVFISVSCERYRRCRQPASDSTHWLMLARHVRIPVGKASFGVVLPRPDVQLVERRQAVAIRGTDVIQQISLQCRRRTVRMALGPVAREHDEL